MLNIPPWPLTGCVTLRKSLNLSEPLLLLLESGAIIPASHSWDADENEHMPLRVFYDPQGVVCGRGDDYH